MNRVSSDDTLRGKVHGSWFMVRARTLAGSSTIFFKLAALYELCAAHPLRTTHYSFLQYFT